MKDPAGALAARIEEFERAADPQLVLDEAAPADAEEAMRACTGGPRDAAVWRLIGALHLARYRLGLEEDEAAVAGVFFAAVAVLDPGGLPERLRGPHVPAVGSAETWAGLVEQVFQHVDVAARPHVGLLVHAILRRALAEPTAAVCDRLGRALLEQALDVPEPAWAPEALAILGNGLVRLYRTAGDEGALDDAVHVLFRAALAGSGHVMDLAAALGHALPGDIELIRAYLLAVGRPAGPERSAALLDLLGLAAARASASCADADLLALLRVGQACLDHWHEPGAHPAVLSRYGAALVEWYVVTGDLRSLEAGRDMLATLPPADGVAMPAGLPDVAADVDWWPEPGRLSDIGPEPPSGPRPVPVPAGPAHPETSPSDDPVVRLDLLGQRHWRRYRRTGDLADLEIAVQTLRQAVVRAPEGHPDRPAFLADLAFALVHRAARTGDDGAAVSTARAAVAACPAYHPRRPRTLLLLARALSLDLTPRAADEAIAALREAIAAEQEPRFQAEAHAVLSDVLRHRAMMGSDPATDLDTEAQVPRRSADPDAVRAAHRSTDLDAAVEAARRSADLAHRSTDLNAAVRAARRFAGGLAAHRSTDLDAAVQAAGLVQPPGTTQIPYGHPSTPLPPADSPDAAASDPLDGPPPRTTSGEPAAPLALVKGLLARFTVRSDERDLVEALELAANLPGGDPELTSLLRRAISQVSGAPDEPLAEAATRLAMVCDDEETTRDLLRLGERHARTAGTPAEPEIASKAEDATDSGDPTGAADASNPDAAGAGGPDGAQGGGVGTVGGDRQGDGTVRGGREGGSAWGGRKDGSVLGGGEGGGAWSGREEGSAWGGRQCSGAFWGGEGAADGVTGAGGTSGRAASGVREARAAEAAGAFLVGAAAGMAGRGRRRMAIELLERAERVHGEVGEVARAADASARIGREHGELGAWEAALRAFERAADGYRAVGRPREEAAQRAAMGDACAGAGEPRRAVTCYEQAVELCREAGLEPDEATYQEKAAVACLEAGDRAAALERAGRARELHLARGGAERAARALIPGARASAGLGHLPAAAELIRTCAAELEALGKWDDACQALDGHAVLLYDLGHADHAAACEAAVVDVVRRRGRRREPADEWYHIARRRLFRGDVPGARRACQRAERGYHQLGHQDGVAAVRYHLGVIGFTGGGMEQAAQDFGTAAEAFAAVSAPEREAAARTMRAACLVELGRHDEAWAELERAMRPAVAEGDIAALFSIALVRATADLRSGDAGEALDRLRAAMGLAAGDPLREAVVHERLAVAHASAPATTAERPPAHPSDVRATGSRPHDQPHAGPTRADDSLAETGRRAAGAEGWALESCVGIVGAEDSPAETGRWTAGAAGFGGGFVGVDGSPAETGRRSAGVAGVRGRTAGVGDPAAVVEHLGLAVDGFRSAGCGGLAALASLRLGFALEERGDLRRARKAIEEGLGAPVAGPVGDAPYEVIPIGGADPEVLARLAELRFATREVTRGRTALAQALAAVRRGGADPALAEQLAERVRIEDAEEAGDLSGALALARRAADSTGDPRRRSELLVKLCALALAAGDPEGAYAYASHGCELRDGLLAEHLRGRGAAAVALGRTAEAIGHLSESVRLARGCGQAMPVRLVAALGPLGAALAEDRRWADAQAVLAEALALAAGPAWRGMRASLLAVRASTRSGQGDVDGAAALYREALALGEAAGDDATVATVCLELAPVQAAGGDRDGAVRLAERALEIDRARGRQRAVVRDLIALGRLGEGDRLAEALSLAQRIGFAEGHAVALAELAALDLRAGRFSGARDRASAAIDLLEGGPHRPELAAAYATRAAAREELGELAAALADAEHAGDLDDPRPGAVAALRSRAVGLAVRLGRADTAWAHAERARETLLGPEEHTARILGGDAGRILGVLPGGTGVVAFHAGEAFAGMVAHRDGWALPRAFGTSAGPELLAEFAAAARAGEGGRRRAELWRRVADLLLGEVVEALGDDLDVLYLLPHGVLHGLPLHALAPGGRLLLDRYAVAYAPSAATLARLALRRAGRGGPSLVAGQGEEAEAVAAVVGTTPVTAAARDLEGVWDTVHLACAACYDSADPDGSGLRLPGGLLNARAVRDLRIEARLVSVADCEPPPAGAGVAALGHALLHAGAAAALLPQWPVHPEVVRELLPSFHARLATGGPGEALRWATLESRELYGSSRPELWAPYALIGLAA